MHSDSTTGLPAGIFRSKPRTASPASVRDEGTTLTFFEASLLGGID